MWKRSCADQWRPVKHKRSLWKQEEMDDVSQMLILVSWRAFHHSCSGFTNKRWGPADLFALPGSADLQLLRS